MVKIMNQDQDLDLYFMMICRCSMGVFIPVSKFFCFGKKQAFKGIAPPSPNDCSIKSPLSHVLSLKLHLKLPLRISLDLFLVLSLNVSQQRESCHRSAIFQFQNCHYTKPIDN